jgi:hypothetical protein
MDTNHKPPQARFTMELPELVKGTMYRTPRARDFHSLSMDETGNGPGELEGKSPRRNERGVYSTYVAYSTS